jgi:Ca-activated chloride channel family protein
MVLILLRLAVLAFVSATQLLAQEPDYTLKIDVPLVTVDVTAEDPAGNTVNNLLRDDFEIYEDGVRQQIRYFAPVSTPYNVMLLFDRSGSTQDKWPLMMRAIGGFIASLRPQDKIAIATFDYDLQVQQEWTSDRERAIQSLPKLLQGDNIGGTNFYDAVERSLRREFRNTSGRRALVVLTDGRDTSFYKDIVSRNRLLTPEAERPFQSVLKTARRQRIPVYFVAFNTDRNLQPNTISNDEYLRLRVIFRGSDIAERYLAAVRSRMEQLADASGGHILYPETLDDIVPLYRQMGQELGTSYSLGYLSSNSGTEGTFRRIEVRIRGAAYRLSQSRVGYYSK